MMKVSTKGRYGLRAMVDLCIHSSNEHVPLMQIAERQKISLNYLEQVFSVLRKSGFVKSVKGAGGGYLLAKDPKDIPISDILFALEGHYSIVDDAFLQESLDHTRMAVNQLVFQPINEAIRKLSSTMTLADLVEEYYQLNIDGTGIYYI